MGISSSLSLNAPIYRPRGSRIVNMAYAIFGNLIQKFVFIQKEHAKRTRFKVLPEARSLTS